MYGVRGLKKLEGIGGFRVTLCKDGKPIAIIINENGNFLWTWVNKKARQDYAKLVNTSPDVLLKDIIERHEFKKQCKRYMLQASKHIQM
mgnify:CR=1 FL=1